MKNGKIEKKERGTDIEQGLSNKKEHMARNTRDKLTKVLTFSDLHYPDNINLSGIMELAKDEGFDEVIYIGDVINATGISKYTGKDMEQGIYETMAEFEGFNKEIHEVMKGILPKAKFTLILGNHEGQRIEKAIDGLPDRAKLLDLKKLLPGLKTVRYGSYYKVGDLYYTHGNRFGDTCAKQTLADTGKNTVFGHCFDMETELLTDNGWAKIGDVKEGGIVTTMNLGSGLLEYNKVDKEFEYDNYRELIEIKGKNVDLLVTKDHGVVDFQNVKPKLKKAVDLLERSNFKFLCAGNGEWAGVPLSDDEIRLLVWISADGSLEYEPSKLVRFHLKKERKILRLESLLRRLSIGFSKSELSKVGTIKINFNLPESLCKFFDFSNKTLPEALRDVNFSQAEVILEEYSVTDGHRYGEAYQLCTSKDKEADLLQEILVKNGFRVNKTLRANNCITLSVFSSNRFNNLSSKKNLKVVPYSGKVKCVSVKNGTLLVRRNGKVCLTQNSHTVAEYTKHYMADDEPMMAKTIGCLRTLDPNYRPGEPNKWINAFHVAFVREDGRFYEYTIKILKDGSFMWNNKVYRPKPKKK